MVNIVISIAAIEKRARAEGAKIYWGDEMALISAVTNHDTVRWMILTRAINVTLLIEFLRRLARDADRKVFLILDNLKVHHAPAVTAWLEVHADRIEVFFIPSSSPELNRDELLNGDRKAAVTKKAHGRRKGR